MLATPEQQISLTDPDSRSMATSGRGSGVVGLMKTLPRVASEMALHVLAYNLTRVMNIMGIQPLMAAIRA
jgi:hypothetical protein